MKRMRIFLSALAVVFATGAVVASNVKIDDTITGYKWIPGTFAVCQQVNVNCDTTSPNLCTLDTHKVGVDNSISTSCGNQLRME